MRRVKIVDVPAPTAQGYRWQWQAEDGTTASTRAFDLFYECLADARSRGYEVQLGPSPANLGSSKFA